MTIITERLQDDTSQLILPNEKKQHFESCVDNIYERNKGGKKDITLDLLGFIIFYAYLFFISSYLDVRKLLCVE